MDHRPPGRRARRGRSGRRHRRAQRQGPRKTPASFKATGKAFRLVYRAARGLVIAMMALTVLSSLVPAGQAILTGLTIEAILTGMASGDAQPVYLPILMQLALAVVSQVMGRTQSVLRNLLGLRFQVHIETLVLAHADKLDLASFENPDFYDQLTRARQDAGSRPLQIVQEMFGLFGSLVTLASLLGLLLQLDWWIVMVVALAPLPSFFVELRYGRNSYETIFAQSQRERQKGYLSMLLTTNHFTKEVKLFNLGQFIRDRFRQISGEIYDENRHLELRYNYRSVPPALLSAVISSGLLYYLAWQATHQRITLGEVSQFIMVLASVGGSLYGVLSGVSQLYQNNLFITNLFTFLAVPPTVTAPAVPAPLRMTATTTPAVGGPSAAIHRGHLRLVAGHAAPAGDEAPLWHAPSRRPSTTGWDRHASTPLIEFRDVCFYYPGHCLPALYGVSFQIYPGQHFSLVGENGAGKTTLVKLMTRLYDPTSGQILLAGRDIRDYDPHDVRKQIGVLFQDFSRYEMTAAENIGVGRVRDIDDADRIAAAAERSGAAASISKLPAGYDSMLGLFFDKGVDLSGGEWQKIALARAFMRDSPLLILDEPTSAMDARSERDAVQRFLHLGRDRTIFFISHRFGTVRLAQHILVIHRGRLLEQGSHQQLMARRGRYAELYAMQAEAYQDPQTAP
jgi:ATP-binding cassette subfamily B protein